MAKDGDTARARQAFYAQCLRTKSAKIWLAIVGFSRGDQWPARGTVTHVVPSGTKAPSGNQRSKVNISKTAYYYE